MRTKVFFMILTFLVLCPLIAGANNPFLSGTQKEEKTIEQQSSASPVFLQKMFRPLLKVQRELHAKMSRFTRQLKDNPSVKTIVLLFAIAFSYGVIHALGPGHGKAIAVSYFISEDAQVKKGALLGCLVAFMHAGISVVLVLVLYGLVSSTLLVHVENTSRAVSLISYALVTLIGLTLLFLHIKKMRQRSVHARRHDEPMAADSNKSLVSVALAAGIVPCPGTILLLIFSLSIDMLFLGIMLALAIAIGMAVTISSAGIVAIMSRKVLLDVFLQSRHLRIMLSNGLELIGFSAIVLLGGALFISNI